MKLNIAGNTHFVMAQLLSPSTLKSRGRERSTPTPDRNMTDLALGRTNFKHAYHSSCPQPGDRL